jgi:uncharacterized iron-regulated protein
MPKEKKIVTLEEERARKQDEVAQAEAEKIMRVIHAFGTQDKTVAVAIMIYLFNQIVQALYVQSEGNVRIHYEDIMIKHLRQATKLIIKMLADQDAKNN